MQYLLLKYWNMKKLHRILLLIVCALLISSCSSDPISRLRSLCEAIEEDGSNFTGEDWEGVIAEFQEIQEELAEGSYTQDELKEIGRLEARFYVKAGSKLGGAYMRGVKSEIEGIIEELDNTDFEQIMKEEGLDELFEGF